MTYRRPTVVAIVIAIALICTPTGRGAAREGPLRIAVIGDSLALGTGASDPTNALAFRLYRALVRTHPGAEVTNAAIGGSRVDDVRRLQIASLDPKTNLVLAIVGGNDVVRRTPVATFARAYRALLAAIRARVPHASVVAFGVPDVARSPLFADTRAKTESLSRRDNVAVREAANASHATFVDLFAVTYRDRADASFFSSDDFHPNDAGYERLADFALPAVARAIDRSSSNR